MTQVVVPPMFQIELAIESAPRVRVIAANESEEQRLNHWIANQDSIYELVVRALEIADEAQTA